MQDTTTSRRDSSWGLARTVAAAFGVIYVLMGLFGFIQSEPFVTDSTQGLDSATGSVLGLFPINALHNIVHLLLGAILVYGATSRGAAIGALKGVGVIYVVLGIAGFISPDGFGLVPLGGTDILLHFGTALVLLAVAFLDRDERDTREARAV